MDEDLHQIEPCRLTVYDRDFGYRFQTDPSLLIYFMLEVDTCPDRLSRGNSQLGLARSWLVTWAGIVQPSRLPVATTVANSVQRSGFFPIWNVPGRGQQLPHVPSPKCRLPETDGSHDIGACRRAGTWQSLAGWCLYRGRCWRIMA